MPILPSSLATVSLIPGGCPQFLDFALPMSALEKMRSFFYEEKRSDMDAPSPDTAVQGGQGTRNQYSHYLHCLEKSEDLFLDKISGAPCDYDYEIQATKNLDIWLNQWLPLPFLRTREQKW
ncbi:MAG: virulence factor SrfB, partial [Desulfovibrionaceae bacterium]